MLLYSLQYLILITIRKSNNGEATKQWLAISNNDTNHLYPSEHSDRTADATGADKITQNTSVCK